MLCTSGFVDNVTFPQGPAQVTDCDDSYVIYDVHLPKHGASCVFLGSQRLDSVTAEPTTVLLPG